MRITLRQLEVFTAIASHGQVTRAAHAVAMTQAAASMALADLEQQLGVTLFDRVGRQLILNDSGRLLLLRAQDVLDRASDLESVARGKSAVFDLRIGASVTIGNHLLPEVVAGLKRRFPQAQVSIYRYNTEQVLAQLSDFRIDLGFIEGPLADARFRRFPWKRDQLLLFAAPGHPLVGRVLAPSDLNAAEWVVRERGSGTREVLERACAAVALQPRIVLELEQPEAIRQCVRAGLGIGCLPDLDLAESFRSGALVPLKTRFLTMERSLDAVIHQRKFISRGMAAMLDECGIRHDDDGRLS